jgi:hypothetical protein
VLDVAADPQWRRVRVTGFVKVSMLGGVGTGATEVTPNSRFLASARASRRQLENHLLGREHSSTSDAEVREIVGHYVESCAAAGLDPLLAAAQMTLETGNLTSFWSAAPRRNLAGIGVTGAPGAGVSFPSWSTAVRAHVGRLLRYAVPKGQETPAQKLLIAEALRARDLPESHWGLAPTLAGLAGTWAMDAAYASKIARIANDVRAGRQSDLIPAEIREPFSEAAEGAGVEFAGVDGT